MQGAGRRPPRRACASASCARSSGLTQATTHRLLQQLIDEGLVEQGERSKLYRLSIDFFALAARAGDGGGLRELCRPVAAAPGAALGDSVFLLVRSGFDAVCLDRCEGPFPIRTFTGDIGGRVPLGVGQGALAILALPARGRARGGDPLQRAAHARVSAARRGLPAHRDRARARAGLREHATRGCSRAGQGALVILAHLPEAEQEEVMRFNVPRIQHMGSLDEVFLRTEAARARAQGFANTNSGLIEGMAGAAVPVFDRNRRVVAALSVGTIASRLAADRLPVVIQLLQREAAKISERVNPFDRALRRPGDSLGTARP